VIESIFGCPIYTEQLEIDTEKVLQHVTNARKSNKNSDACPIKEDLYVLENDNLGSIKNLLMQSIKKYLFDSMRFVNDFKITTSWFTEVNPEEDSQYHNHDNSFVSGVLYLKTHKDCGNISFRDFSSTMFNLTVQEYNIINSKEWSYEPKDGLLILFPSKVYHRVNKNKSNQIRNSLAFNVIPKGLIGNKNSDSHIYL
jgi:hypothetical protein